MKGFDSARGAWNELGFGAQFTLKRPHYSNHFHYYRFLSILVVFNLKYFVIFSSLQNLLVVLFQKTF